MVVVAPPPVLQLDPQNLNDRPGLARNGQDILASGGCAWKGDHHENGETWHPHVMPWGEMKCVSCACKVRLVEFEIFIKNGKKVF